MAHACSAFTVAAFVAVWLRVREQWSARGIVALGAMAALMTMVREQDVFFVLGIAVDFLWSLADSFGRGQRTAALKRVKALPAGFVSFAIVFLPQAWAYRVLNGHLGPARIVSDKMQWYAPHAVQVLFSLHHGFFVWTPIALLCVAGLVAQGVAWPARTDSRADARRIVICLLVMFLAEVYITGSVGTWTVAGSFGQRRFVGTSVALIVGLTALLQKAKGWRRAAAGIVIVLSVWWNLGLMVQFGADMMDRQQLNLPDNMYNTFVRVPRELPELAYRYLFNRSSFYRPPHG